MILWASGDSSPTVFLNPVNPSMATTSTHLRQAWSRWEGRVLRGFLERSGTTSSRWAGPAS